MFPWWTEQLPSDTLTLGSSLLAAFISFHVRMTVNSQIKLELFGLFKAAFEKTSLSCHLSSPPNPGDAERKLCCPPSAHSFFHTRLEGPCGILRTQISRTRRVDEHFFNWKLYAQYCLAVSISLWIEVFKKKNKIYVFILHAKAISISTERKRKK